MAAFRRQGRAFFALALWVAVFSIALTILLGRVQGFETGISAGMMAGALTSTPTLVSAQDAFAAMDLSPELAAAALTNLSSAYALTYLFGVLGLILLISIMPALFRIDLPAACREYEKENMPAGRPAENRFVIKAYRVEQGLDVSQWELGQAGAVLMIKRRNEVFPFQRSAAVEPGDIVSISAPDHVHASVREHVGPEVFDQDVIHQPMQARVIIFSSFKLRRKRLEELDFAGGHGCWLTQIVRSGQELPRRADLELLPGDALYLTGPAARLDELETLLGHSQQKLDTTDLLSFAIGIAVGLLLGIPYVYLGAAKVTLGSAGGVLIAGLLMGILNNRRPFLGSLPPSARQILMDFGLLLFMVTVGINAGTGIVEVFRAAGLPLLLSGAVLTIAPVLAGFAFGKYVLKLNAAILLGGLTGAMTSTAAMKQANELAGSQIPMIGYIGAYTFANIFLTVAGAVVARF
jgi:putative transport protein